MTKKCEKILLGCWCGIKCGCRGSFEVLCRPVLILGCPPNFCYLYSAFKGLLSSLSLSKGSNNPEEPRISVCTHRLRLNVTDNRVSSLQHRVCQDSSQSIWSKLGLIQNTAVGGVQMVWRQSGSVTLVKNNVLCWMFTKTCSSTLL